MPTVSTSEPLGEEAEWISEVQRRFGHHRQIEGTVFSDQDGVLHIEQSSDRGEHWDVDSEYAIDANENKGFIEPLVGGRWRVRFVNGSSDQKELRISATAMPPGA